MAARGTINELYDIQSLDAQQQAVLAFVKQYVDQVKAASNVKIKLGGADSAKEITSAIKQLSDEQKKLVDLTLKLASAEDKYAAARLKNSKADTQDVKTKKEKADLEVKLAKEKERLIKLAEKEAKVIEKSNNEYIKLNEQYKIAAAASQKRGAELLKEANGNEKLFLSLLKTDKEYIATTKSAKTYFDQLTLLEQNVGKAQRNVGNYASAFNGLSASFGQVARELPSLAINFQTFALAISNNLPIAIDEISRARAEIAKLRADGQAAPTLFSQITKSIFSLQVGLSIAITAFVLYSKQISEFVQGLFASKEAIDKTKLATETLNKAFEDTSVKDAVTNVNELTINIGLAKEGLISKEKVVKQYNETIGKTTGQVKNLDEAEAALVKNGPAYIQMMLFKAAANLALEEAAKKAFEAEQVRRKKEAEFAKGLDRAGAGLGSVPDAPGDLDAEIEKRAQDLAAKRKKAAEKSAEDSKQALLDIANKFQKDAADISKQFKFDFFGGEFDSKDTEDAAKKLADLRKSLLEDELKAQRELIILRLQNEADAQQRIIESDKFTYEERINAANNFYEISRTLLQTELNQELAAIDKKAKDAKVGESEVQQQKELVKLQFNGRFLDLERRLGDQILDITKANVDKEEKVRLEALQKRLKAIENAGSIEVSQLQKQRDEEILALSERANATAMSFEEQQKERLKILVKYAKLELEAQLKKVEELIKLETDPVKRASLEAQAAAIRLKIDDDLTAEKIKNLKDVEAEEKKLADLQKQLQQEVFTLIKTFTLGRFDVAKNQIQDQIDKTEEAKRKEIDAINATTLSAQEKQARISNAEKKAQNERERLEQRQRQLDRQRAQFERAFAIAQIIQNQAVAIAKIFKDYTFVAGLPLAALMASIGAVQIASVLAQPIPKFKTGKGAYDDYEGPAWVGDGGKSEMIFREDGSVERTPATPVMTWVGKNDIIHPDADAWLNHTLKKQGEVYPYNMAAMFAFGELSTTMKNGFNQLDNTITNKREWIVNLNNGKPSIMSKDGSRVKQYLNDNLQFGK